MLEKLRVITTKYGLDMGRIEQVDELVEQIRVDVEEELRKKVNEKLVLHEFSEVPQITKDISELVVKETKDIIENKEEEKNNIGDRGQILIELIHRRREFVRATAECYPEHTILKAGSQIQKDHARTIPPEIRRARELSINSGELVEKEKYYELLEDKKFSDPMSAGLFVVGDNEVVIKGFNYWTIVENGNKLPEITEDAFLFRHKESRGNK